MVDNECNELGVKERSRLSLRSIICMGLLFCYYNVIRLSWDRASSSLFWLRTLTKVQFRVAIVFALCGDVCSHINCTYRYIVVEKYTVGLVLPLQNVLHCVTLIQVNIRKFSFHD